MNLLHAQPQVQAPSARNPEPPSAADTRLYGRRLILARAVWAVLAVFTLFSLVASFVVYAVHIRDVCTAIPWITVCRLGQLVSGSMQLLGLSVDSYGMITVALMIVWALVWLVVAGVIFWHKSYDWMALLVSLLLITGAGTVVNITLLSEFDSRWQIVGQFLGFLVSILIILVSSLFPNGRFVPRWMRWLAVVLIALSIGANFFPNSPFNFNNWPGLLSILVFLGLFGSLVFAQVYRYLRVSSPVERRQTKWVIFAFTTVILGFLVGGLGLDTLPQYFPALSLPGPLFQFFDTIIWNFSFILIPICFAIAILRFRLYNIDIIINRTLVYGTLTATLAVVYVGSILILQALSRGFTGGNTLALVGSTLVIAALFQPLRRRIQRVIDRHFYRSKYDATQTLAAFAGTLRGEIDLNELSERLVAVVQETMQPAHVSLWLRRASEQNMTHNTIAWVSHTLTPNQKELLPVTQHPLTQPVNSLRGTEEY